MINGDGKSPPVCDHGHANTSVMRPEELMTSPEVVTSRPEVVMTSPEVPMTSPEVVLMGQYCPTKAISCVARGIYGIH